MDLGVAVWPTVVDSEEGNAFRAGEAAKRSGSRAPRRGKAKRIQVGSDIEETEPQESVSVSALPKPSRASRKRLPVDPPVAPQLAATPSASGGERLGRTHSYFLESPLSFEAILSDPERTSTMVEDARITVHGILKSEKGHLDTFATTIRNRRYMLRGLLERMDADISELNGTLLDEVTSSSEEPVGGSERSDHRGARGGREESSRRGGGTGR